jgi:hypothetical protein
MTGRLRLLGRIDAGQVNFVLVVGGIEDGDRVSISYADHTPGQGGRVSG